MANTYPYVASAGPLVKAIQQFRKSFPQVVDADTLRKLAIAPKNESYVINVLRFLGAIDHDGKKDTAKSKAFLNANDEKFNEEFGELVKSAYSELFELHGEDSAWALSKDDLVQFFRTSDGSGDIVGQRQATTFLTLAKLAGHGDLPVPKTATSTKKPGAKKSGGTVGKKSQQETGEAKNKKPKNNAKTPEDPLIATNSSVGLTVRIEVNLPAGGDQKTYDAIFSSIRKNLIDGS